MSTVNLTCHTDRTELTFQGALDVSDAADDRVRMECGVVLEDVVAARHEIVCAQLDDAMRGESALGASEDDVADAQRRSGRKRGNANVLAGADRRIHAVAAGAKADGVTAREQVDDRALEHRRVGAADE